MMNNAVDQLIEDYNQAESEADRERLADLLQEAAASDPSEAIWIESSTGLYVGAFDPVEIDD